MRRPSLLSARSDLDLLYSATRHFRQYMTDSPRNKNIAALITSMYDAAAKFVAQSRAAGSLPGPQTCTPAALADHFSDLPGERGQKPRVSISSGGNPSGTPVTGEVGEFDYSPTIETPMEHPGLELHTSFPLHMPTENYLYNYSPAGDYRGHHDHNSVGPDVAWLAVASQHGTPLPGIGAVGLGVGVGNGWEEWFWQNEHGGGRSAT